MRKSNKKLIYQIANILIPILLLIILSILSIGQGDYTDIFQSTGEKSLIDPAGFTFAIWGPIFIFLAIFLLYQARDLLKSSESKIEMPFIEEISVFFILSTIMAAGWYIFWIYQIIWLSTFSMILYLVSLLIGYIRLDINRKDRPLKEQIAVVIPWSMYTAWITAATIVSITTFLESINFNQPQLILSDTYWAILVLLVTLIIYVAVLLTRNDYIYGGVGIWVLLGILFERLSAPILNVEVIIVCIIGMIVLALGILYKFLMKTL
ncbi:MAG: hypothetical protein EU547_06245 [Promethearchaeota archaeon]|nr:MAG: hypothetical protein EU547_06245 [Candidatus Lokiarchaeota archaeon]